MWSYYGTKTNIAMLYPPPAHGKIIEPFAGAAKYSLLYWQSDVLLVDRYKVLIDIWKWLQQCSVGDILGLPRPAAGQSVDDFDIPAPAKYLLGFIIHFGAYSPGKMPTSHYNEHRPNGINFAIKRIAANLHKIRHWKIEHGDYRDIENENATWFIDPPYFKGGQKYYHGSREINYSELASWCLSRKGEIIVCEGNGAAWLPFSPLKVQTTFNGTRTEFIYHSADLTGKRFYPVQGRLF